MRQLEHNDVEPTIYNFLVLAVDFKVHLRNALLRFDLYYNSRMFLKYTTTGINRSN